MNTAYRLALPNLVPRFLSEADPLGERLIIPAPAPNASFTFSASFCLLAPNSQVRASVSAGFLKIFWETGTETDVVCSVDFYEPTRINLSFTVPADAQVGRLFGKFYALDDSEFVIDPVQVVIRR